MKKATVIQYEYMRQSGYNMLDYFNVIESAGRIPLKPLADLTLEEYQALQTKWGSWCKRYKIDQSRRISLSEAAAGQYL